MSVVAEEKVDETLSNVDDLDNLESAIVEDRPSFNMPKKFEGKSAEEIAQSYLNLESENGRQRNELGTLRKTTDQLLDLTQQPKPIERKAVDVDTLLDDPDAVINSAVSNNPRLRAIENKLKQADLNEAKQRFEANHPDWQKTVESGEFQNWVNGSPVRQKMFEAADKRFNYEVGDELFSTYDVVSKVQIEANKSQRETRKKNGLHAASSEAGISTGGKRKIYRRSDLVNLRIKDPVKYESMYPEIFKAYAEGRVK